MHELINNPDIENRESIYQNSNKCVDIITAIARLILFIKGCKIINFNKILVTDYREFIANINMEDYRTVNHFQIDRVDSSKLDSQRASHNIKFIDKVEELIYLTGFIDRVE